MTFSLVASTKKGGTTSGVTTDAIDTSGADLIVVHVASQAGISYTLSDNKSNTWNALTIHDGNLFTASKFFYAINPTVGSGHTFTTSGVNSAASIQAEAWSGGKLTSPFDQQNGASGTTSPRSTGSVTPSEDNELVIAGLGCFLNATPTISESMTVQQSLNWSSGNYIGGAIAHKVQTALAAINPAWTFSDDFGGYGSVSIATFKAEPAGATLVPVFMNQYRQRR